MKKHKDQKQLKSVVDHKKRKGDGAMDASSKIKPQPATSSVSGYNDRESPLMWLYKRRDTKGGRLIDDAQFTAGEQLRRDFTQAALTPNVTSNWSIGMRVGKTVLDHAEWSDAVIAAKQRLNHALEAVGPEFSGLLLDICCFLKGLCEVERERGWPARSAKIILQLGLTRLARYYGFDVIAMGPQKAGKHR